MAHQAPLETVLKMYFKFIADLKRSMKSPQVVKTVKTGKLSLTKIPPYQNIRTGVFKTNLLWEKLTGLVHSREIKSIKLGVTYPGNKN